MQHNTNKSFRLIQNKHGRTKQVEELEEMLMRKSKFILPIVCPSCKNIVGYLNSSTGYYVIQGQYCMQCGTQVKTVSEER